MNNIQPIPGIRLLNVCKTEAVCHCDAHCGETVTQYDAQLPNGKPIALMQDWRGWHLAIGACNVIGEYPYTQPMSRAQVMQALREAMK